MGAVNCRNKDFLARWHYGLVLRHENESRKKAGQGRRAHLIDEDHGEIVCISADPLPGHHVGSHCRPSTRVAGSEDLVGAGGGDQRKNGEERTHGDAKESRGGGKKGRKIDEGVKIKRKERGFVEGRRTLDACLKGRMGVGRKDKRGGK